MRYDDDDDDDDDDDEGEVWERGVPSSMGRGLCPLPRKFNLIKYRSLYFA